MNIKTGIVYFTFLIFSYQSNISAGILFSKPFGVEAVEEFNKQVEEEILSTSEKLRHNIDEIAEAARKKGEERIKKDAEAYKKKANDALDEASINAYTLGYKFAYNNTIQVAPWIVGSAVVGTVAYLCINKK